MAKFRNIRLILGIVLASLAVLSIGFAPAVLAQTCGPQYTVQQGEWLASIARKCGVTFDAILDANADLPNPNLIFPGQVINIPQGSGGIPVTGATSTRTSTQPTQATQATQGIPVTGGTATPPAGQGSVIVQQGESLANLARRMNVSPEELIRANPNLLLASQTVNMPFVQTATVQPTQGIPVTGGTATATSGVTQQATQQQTYTSQP